MMIPSHCRKPSAWLADDSTVFYRRFDKSPASHPSPALTSNSHPSPPLPSPQHLWTCRVFKNRGARKLEAQTRCHPPVCGANSWPPVRDVWSPHLLQTLSKHPSPQEAQHLRPYVFIFVTFFTLDNRGLFSTTSTSSSCSDCGIKQQGWKSGGWEG